MPSGARNDILQGIKPGRTAEAHALRADTFWSLMTADESGAIDRLIRRLADLDAAYCVVGGQAVNAYVDPLVSLDLDLAIATEELDRVLPALAGDFRIERFPHSLNLYAEGSDLRIQFELDPRYASFVQRAERRLVLGMQVPVARLEDVLQGKVWEAMDPSRPASSRQKDLADIARILETFSALKPAIPDAVLNRLV